MVEYRRSAFGYKELAIENAITEALIYLYLFLKFLFHLQEHLAFMYVYAYSTKEGQKTVSDPLELELQTVVSCHILFWGLNPDPIEE